MFGLKKRTWIIGGVIVAMLGTAAYATKMHHMSSHERAEWASEKISSKLDLNQSQKSALDEVTNSYMELRGTTPEFMLELTDRLKELSADETLTVAEVNVLRDEIKAEFDRRADVLIPEFVTFYNTLDDNQRLKVTKKLDKFSTRIEGHHGKWHKQETEE